MPLGRKRWITAKQFQEEFCISKTQVYKLIHMDGFPVMKFGENTIRIDADGAINYLREKYLIY